MVNNLLLVRVDERLNHGQVMISYMKKYPAKAVLCVDDDTAKDEFLASIIRMTAPPGITIDVVDATRGIEILKAGLSTPTILLVKTPLAIQRLRDGGVDIDAFIIGGIAAAPNRKPFYKSINISQEETDAVKVMLDEGVDIGVQIVASDKRIPVRNLLK